jgi:hypothetical protein
LPAGAVVQEQAVGADRVVQRGRRAAHGDRVQAVFLEQRDQRAPVDARGLGGDAGDVDDGEFILEKSDTPPVICLSAASIAIGSAECRMVEMATTVEILISMGRELGLLDINVLVGLARAFYCEISLKGKGFWPVVP